MNIGDQLNEYIALRKRWQDADREAKELKAKLSQMEPLLVEAMALNGMQSASVNGTTLYRRRDFYCSKRGSVEMDDFVAMLRRHPVLASLPAETVHAGKLKARVKDLLENDGELPPELAAAMNMGELERIGVRTT